MIKILNSYHIIIAFASFLNIFTRFSFIYTYVDLAFWQTILFLEDSLAVVYELIGPLINSLCDEKAMSIESSINVEISRKIMSNS